MTTNTLTDTRCSTCTAPLYRDEIARGTCDDCARQTATRTEGNMATTTNDAETRRAFIAQYGNTGGTLASRAIITAGSRILVGGIHYDVLSYEHAADVAREHPNTAREMLRYGIVARLALRRPRGHRVAMAYRYANGSVCRVVSVA